MIPLSPWFLAPAVLLTDLLVGDPVGITHPVILIGRLIARLDRAFWRETHSPTRQIALGFALWLIVVTASGGITYLAVRALGLINPWLALLANLWLCSTTVAAKSLMAAGQKVLDNLLSGDLRGARSAVGEIVGRDVDRMEGQDVIRATVESVAENTVDGSISPLIYAALGGAPLAMMYRATNTMDSMLGYRDKDYLHFGRAAARLDDVANYLPARVAGACMTLAAAALGLSWKGALLAWRRDAGKHPSPNAGVPESVVAGALGVQLGGINYYDGIQRTRARMGEATRDFSPQHIVLCNRIMIGASLLCAFLIAVIRYGR